jgi:hypothetical protein
MSDAVLSFSILETLSMDQTRGTEKIYWKHFEKAMVGSNFSKREHFSKVKW